MTSLQEDCSSVIGYYEGRIADLTAERDQLRADVAVLAERIAAQHAYDNSQRHYNTAERQRLIDSESALRVSGALERARQGAE